MTSCLTALLCMCARTAIAHTGPLRILSSVMYIPDPADCCGGSENIYSDARGLSYARQLLAEFLLGHSFFLTVTVF